MKAKVDLPAKLAFYSASDSRRTGRVSRAESLKMTRNPITSPVRPLTVCSKHRIHFYAAMQVACGSQSTCCLSGSLHMAFSAEPYGKQDDQKFSEHTPRLKRLFMQISAASFSYQLVSYIRFSLNMMDCFPLQLLRST